MYTSNKCIDCYCAFGHDCYVQHLGLRDWIAVATSARLCGFEYVGDIAEAGVRR